MSIAAYEALMAFQRGTEALAQAAGLLGWDRETMMPPGAAAQRAEWMGAMEEVIHARRTDPRIGEWLAALEGAELDPVAEANLREIRRSWERARRVPADLAAAIARTTSRAQGIWAEARARDDVAHFLPVLEEVVRLRREEAAALAEGGAFADVYDALLDDYEPGLTGAEVAELFARMRPRLVALRERVMGAGAPRPALVGLFDDAGQMRLGRELAERFGYDFDRGRLDRSVHPFSSGSGNDVRITTRVDEADPLGCIYSVIHETGHAVYEQNVDPAHLLTPLGRGASMGVHESQSRLFENQLGRSRAFCNWLFGRLEALFGDAGAPDREAFYEAVNAVRPGYIRTEADELQYNLHIFMRFDLERALIRGELAVADLEEAWNSRFAADFGYPVDRPSDGMLQDVHWSVGLFGYFPTYALGNVYAGCLWAAIDRDLHGVEDELERGETGMVRGWLRERVQRHGALLAPRALIEQATGAPVSEAPLLDYLEEKFSALYGL